MAIDPSISLQAGANQKSFDLGGIFKTGLDIQQAQQALDLGEQKRQANEVTLRYADPMARAALTTAQTAAEKDALEFASRKRISKILSANVTVGTDGKGRVDYSQAGLQAHAAGEDFPTVIDMLTKGAKADADRLDTEDKRNTYGTKLVKVLQDQLRVEPDTPEGHASAAGKIGAIKRIMDQTVGAKSAEDFIASQFNFPRNPDGSLAPLPVGDDGKPDPRAMGAYGIRQARVNAEAEITPQQERENIGRGLSREQVSPNSTQAANMRAFLKTRGMNVPDTMNVPDMLLDQTIRKELEISQYAKQAGIDLNRYTVEQGIIPAAAKVAETQDVNSLQAAAQTMDALGATAAKLTKWKFTPAQLIAGKVQGDILNDPNYREFQTRVQQAQAAGIALNPSAVGGIEQFARNQAALLRQQAQQKGNLVKKKTFVEASNPTEPPAPAPAPAAAPAAAPVNKGSKASLPVINSEASFNKLPSGALFVDARNGKVRRKE